MARRAPRDTDTPEPAAGDRRLYTMEVSIIGGPITEKFANKNPVISRTILDQGDQTLQVLHEAIGQRLRCAGATGVPLHRHVRGSAWTLGANGTTWSPP